MNATNLPMRCRHCPEVFDSHRSIRDSIILRDAHEEARHLEAKIETDTSLSR